MATDTKQGLEAALADINDLIRITEKQIASAENSSLYTAAEKAPRLAALRAELAGYQAQQTALTQQLNQLNLNNNQRNTSSSADTTAQAATARDDSANAGSAPASQMIAVNPDGRVVPAASVSKAPTNATPAATTANGNVDTGTNAETVTLTNSQGIPGGYGTGANNPSLMAAPASKSFSQPQAAANTGGAPGVGAQREDAAKPPSPSNTTTSRLEELFAGAKNAIVSQDNVLDQFASYTYSLSWYVLDHATYNSLATSDLKYIPSYNLLVQSGGIQIQTSGKPGESQQAQNSASAGSNVGRNPFFPLDYYLDNFEFITNINNSPGSRGTATTKELKFTVTEPNGISLQPNLIRAVNQLYVSKGLVKPGTMVNYNLVQYCMVIRFYGYDEKGNLVMPINQRGGQTDRQSVIEKFIPFQIGNINFKVSNKLVEYTITGVPIGEATGFSTDRGSIPQYFQFQGKTVKDILVGTQQNIPIPNDGWGEG